MDSAPISTRVNLAAFDLPIESPAEAQDPPRDADGLLIPPLWQHSPKWLTLPLEYRKRRSEEYEAELAKQQPPKPKRKGSTGPKFTTDYAIKWARRQGWTLVDRERYDYNRKRHHDLQLGLDALFDDGKGLIGVQGAGKSERAEHRKRFEARGGIEKAQRRSIRVVYIEFVRGDLVPVLEEWWA